MDVPLTRESSPARHPFGEEEEVVTAWQSFACDVNGTSYTIPRGTALLGNTRSLHPCELANNQHLRRDDPLVTETLSSSASSRSKKSEGHGQDDDHEATHADQDMAEQEHEVHRHACRVRTTKTSPTD